MGTYKLAAARLNATQPAISARIVALEQHLNVKLFDRSGHRVALTPHGRRFLSYAEKLLAIRAEAQLEVGKSGELSGIVRIGAADTMAITWLPDFLVGLKAQFPNISPELTVGHSARLRDELVEQKIDIAFIVGPVSNPEIVNYPLCECPMVLAAAPSLGLHGRELNVRELNDIDILTFERLSQPYQSLRRDLRRAEVSARLNPISSLGTAVLLIKKGLGVGAVPLAAIEKELETGELELLHVDFHLTTLCFAICRRHGPSAPVVQAIAERALEFTTQLAPSKSINFIYQTECK